MQTTQSTDVDVPGQEPLPLAVLETVYDAFEQATGRSLPEPSRAYSPPEYEEGPHDVGHLPEWYLSNDIDDFIKHGLMGLDFELRESQEGESTESRDKSHFTAVFVNEEYSIKETVHKLAETGEIERATARLSAVVDNADEVVAFALAMYLKGAVVERVLTENTERFTKGSVSNDQYGQDCWDNQIDGYRQIKCVTHRNQEEELAAKKLYYQFDGNGKLWVGDDWKEVADAAYNNARSDISKTLTYRQHSEMDRTRYLWW
jgi:hypothetical protein